MSTKEILDSLAPYVPFFQTLVWAIIILIVFFLLKKQIQILLCTFTVRLKKGSSLKIGPLELGSEHFITKTDDLKHLIDKQEVKIFGDPDRFVLLLKAEKSGSWAKSTKAMQVPGGCIVQVSSERKGSDNTWAVAEALTFVPGVAIVNDPQSGGRYLDVVV